MYSLAWLGLALGLSHLTRSSGKTVALGLLAVVLLSVAPTMLDFLVAHHGWPQALLHLEALAPSAAKSSLWRSSPVALTVASFQLATLGFVYLMAGAAVFARRDA